MGRGNVCVFGDYEGLYYVDRDYLDCYIAKETNEDGEYEEKMLGDMSMEDFEDYDYDEFLSHFYYEDFIQEFTSMMEKKFKSFTSTGKEYGVIMENNLFEIEIEDNEWSYAVKLIQKEDWYDNHLEGLQKKHYENYLNGIKNISYDLYPITNSFDCYDYDANETPIALDISKKVLTVPMYAGLTVEEVDKLNVYEASRQAMMKCIRKMKHKVDYVLSDAMPIDFEFPCLSIIKGDAKSASIAAASIIAKVERDHYMVELDKEYPMYGFKKHKGYGTKQHMQALREFGPSPIHRKKFIRFLDEE